MLLCLFRRELPWAEANLLWDSLFARHALMHTGAGEECSACKASDSGNGEKMSVGRGVSARDDTPESDQAAVGPSHVRHDIRGGTCLRPLCVAAAAALLMLHRDSFMRCNSLGEVVQQANRLPDLGPGTGLRLAARASELIALSSQPAEDNSVGVTCACAGRLV